MKFLSILKDSYREAVDGKIFQAMIVLAVLFILFIASISYRPVTLDEEIGRRFRIVNRMLSFGQGNKGATKIEVENFRIANGATEPWNSDYELDIVTTTPDEATLTEIRKSPFPATASSVRRMFEDEFFYLTNLTVEEVPQADPGHARIRVNTRGTTVTEATAWPHEPTLLFGVPAPIFNGTLRSLVYRVEQNLVNTLGGIAVLLVGVIITAGFVPNLMRKGTLDLYIVKPIGRTELLIYKYIGGLLFVFLLTLITVLGVWVVIGLRTGIWTPEFLLLIPILTFYFAILYAVSVLFGTLTRSALVAILAALIAWGTLSLVGYLNDQIRTVRQAEEQVRKMLQPGGEPTDAGEESALGLPRWVESTLYTVGRVLPRGWDLDTQASRTIARGVLTEQEIEKRKLNEVLPSWGETIGISLAWIALLLGLACWRFETRDG